MVQLNPVPVFGAKKYTITIWHKFFTEISVQMVSAPGFFPFPQVVRPTTLIHCLMTRSSDWDEVFKGIGRGLLGLLMENDSRAL